MNVLLSCGGRRSYLVEWFRRAAGGRVVVANSEQLTSAMAVADQAVVSPPISSGEYVPFLLDVCRREDVALVVPLFDLELPVLAAATEEFAAAGVVVAVSAPAVVASCADKLATAEAVSSGVSLRVPRTTLDPDEAAGWLADGAPEVFVKPRFGTGSILTLATSEPAEVAVLQGLVARQLGATHVPGSGRDDVVVQEAAVGQEHGLTVVNDLHGNFRAVLAGRKVAMRAGETDVAVVEHDPRLDDAGRELAGRLRHVGALDVDVFVDGSTVTVIDVNARIGGNYPFAHLAGADLPLAYVRWTEGGDVDDEVFATAPGTVGVKAIAPLRIGP